MDSEKSVSNNNIIDIFLEIVKPSVGENMNLQVAEKIEKTDMNKLLHLVMNSDAATMTYDGISELMKDTDGYEDIMIQWKKSAVSLGCYQVQHLYNVKNIYELLEKENIEPILFKGIIIGDLYESECFRISKDTDILVSSGQFAEAKRILSENAYVYNEKKSKTNVAVYENEILKHKVELHTSLYEDYEGEKIEILKKLKIEADTICVNTKIGKFRTLNETNHLIFQIFHIVKHFTVQGISIKYLTDLKVFIDGKYDKIDWERFEMAMRALGYKDFTDFVLYVLATKLSLRKGVNLEKSKYSDDDIRSFLDDVIHKGDIKDSKASDYQMLTVLKPYMVGNVIEAGNSKARKLRAVFPKSGHLSDYYMYAKKCRILLPIAWIHRILVYFGSRMVKRKDKRNLMNHREKFDIMEYRIKLLKITGLVK